MTVLIDVPILAPNPELLESGFPGRVELLQNIWTGRPVASPPIVRVGRVVDRARFVRPYSYSGRAFDIRFAVDSAAGVARYELPDEMEQFQEAVYVSAQHQHSSGYSLVPYGVARAIAYQNFVKAGAEHVDGVPHRDKPPHKNLWWQAYVTASKDPTLSYATEDAKYPYYAVEGEKVTETPGQLADFDVGFASHLSLHSSATADEDGWRTFLRIIYTHDASSEV